MVEAETLALAALGVGAYAYLSGGTAEKPRDKAIEIPTFPQIQVLRKRVPKVVRVPETKIIEIPTEIDNFSENLSGPLFPTPPITIPDAPEPPDLIPDAPEPSDLIPDVSRYTEEAGREAGESVMSFFGGFAGGVIDEGTDIAREGKIWIRKSLNLPRGGLTEKESGPPVWGPTVFGNGKRKERKEREAPTRIRKRRKRKSRIRKRRKRKSRQRKDKDRGPSSVSVIRKRRERLGFRPKTTEWGAQFWA